MRSAPPRPATNATLHSHSATLPIASGAIATSGDYERFLEFEGKRYSHILNPRTGESVQGFQSVTAFAPTSLVAGSITTMAMLKGERDGKAWLYGSGCQFLAVDAAGQVLGNPQGDIPLGH